MSMPNNHRRDLPDFAEWVWVALVLLSPIWWLVILPVMMGSALLDVVITDLTLGAVSAVGAVLLSRREPPAQAPINEQRHETEHTTLPEAVRLVCGCHAAGAVIWWLFLFPVGRGLPTLIMPMIIVGLFMMVVLFIMMESIETRLRQLARRAVGPKFRRVCAAVGRWVHILLISLVGAALLTAGLAALAATLTR